MSQDYADYCIKNKQRKPSPAKKFGSYGITLSRDGKYIAVTLALKHWEGMAFVGIYKYDVTKDRYTSLLYHLCTVPSLMYSPEPQFGVVQGQEKVCLLGLKVGSVAIYNLEDGRLDRNHHLLESPFQIGDYFNYVWSAQQNRMLIRDKETIKLWDLAKGEKLAQVSDQSGTHIAVDAQGVFVVAKAHSLQHVDFTSVSNRLILHKVMSRQSILEIYAPKGSDEARDDSVTQ